MIDILSLPRRNKLVGGKLDQHKTGLPINSLPGWELIPLNCKLPMLKCPGNQVIFSKDKIGNSVSLLTQKIQETILFFTYMSIICFQFKCSMQEFDSSATINIPEYNPLHDSNLKTFYANERNLKRLRMNGEITDNNEVICNLKDFNQFREDLHKSQLYYVLQAYRQREAERHDRLLIANAERISRRDDNNPNSRQNAQEDVMMRKQTIEEERHLRMVQLYSITEEKFKHVENMAEMQQMLLEHRKMLTNIRIQSHLGLHQDLQRKHLIKLKKLFQFKKDRYNKNMHNLHKQRLMKSNEGQIQSWHKRLNERIDHQRRIDLLLAEMAEEREEFIERHKAKYQLKWEQIQEEIKNRSRLNKLAKKPKRRKRKGKKSKLLRRAQPSFCDEYKSTFEGLLNSELCYALNAAIQMEGHAPLTFAPDDPIYKAAQYIINYILQDFNKDLSDDKCAMSVLVTRISNFLCDAKKYVNYVSCVRKCCLHILSHSIVSIYYLQKAIQLIGFARESNAIEIPPTSQKSHSRGSHVSFSGVACTIGMGSYEIHPFVDIRPCSERRPTPAGSLTSLVVGQVGEQVAQAPHIQMPHLSRSEVVFIEHYMVNFKRDLLVGLDKQVFAAIQCHFENRIMDVREELLELDKEFLYNQIAVGILSFAVNPLNFETALMLAINVVSSEIIWELQQTLLKPGVDPVGMSHPTSCGTDKEREQRAFCSA